MSIKKGRIFNHRDGMSELKRFEMEHSSLPKWIEDCKKLSETYGFVHDKPLFEALSIAWEALEQIRMYARVVHDKPKDYGEVVDTAQRRIEELGKESK
jgi:hypothetical protein